MMTFMRVVRWTAAVALAGVLAPAALAVNSGRVEYYHYDAAGNVRVVTDENGQVLERHDYLPFGEECTTGACAANPGVGAGQPRKFTGKERDAETGLDYFGARYYSSRIGRFTTVDPAYLLQANLLDPQRWNKYAYARNNPLKYTDPDGRLIDIIADAGFIAYDLIDIGVTRFTGGEVSATQQAALAADIAAAAIPFATGAGVAIRGGARAEHAIDAGRAGALVQANRAVGKAAEAKIAAEVVEGGGSILGSQVCCKTELGRRVIDHVVENAGGKIAAIEVKSGKAIRSAAQRAKDAEIAAGRGTFVGKNAGDLKGQTIPVETIERRVP